MTAGDIAFMAAIRNTQNAPVLRRTVRDDTPTPVR